MLLPSLVQSQDSNPSVQKVQSLATKYVTQYFERFPELATTRGVQGANHSSISDPSLEAVERWEVLVDSLYDQLQTIEVSKLAGSETWVTYGYLKEELESNIQIRICREELSDVDQVNGRQIMLKSKLENAHYLVLDTGIHALGWRRQQAIDYLAEHMGGSMNNIARLIDYIIISPGQTTSYMVGNQQIQQLRTLADTELGDGFAITSFHDLLLSEGSIPLHMLQEKVDKWIQSQ